MTIQLPKWTLSVVLSMALASTASVAQAGSVSANVQSTAKISSVCTIATNTINFGNIAQQGSSSAYTVQTENFQMLCSKNAPYTIQIDLGANTSGGARYMVGAVSGQKIQYGICSQNMGVMACNAQTAWNPQVPAHAFTGTGTTQTIPAYVSTNTGYYVPDNYSDTATVTVAY
jgi:spore coat protein U-like protein